MSKKKSKSRENLIYTWEEFKQWRQYLAALVKQIREEKQIFRKNSVGPNGYPSYTLLCEIESFQEDIHLSSLYLILRLLDLKIELKSNTPDSKPEDDATGEPEAE